MDMNIPPEMQLQLASRVHSEMCNAHMTSQLLSLKFIIMSVM